MLEGLISKILGPLLDKYLIDFDRSQLNLSLASGNVFVQQLLVKDTALQDIHPGLLVSYGILDNVKVSFNALRLSSVPIEVEISNMALMISSKDDLHIKPEEIEEWLHEKLIGKIQALLAAQEMFQEQMKLGDSEITQSKFVKKLVTKIINNLKIKINRVHVRIELPEENSAIGVALGQLVIHSVNENNEEIIVKETDGLLRKRVIIRDFSVYCSPMINKISSLPKQRQKMFLLQTIATKDNWQETNFQYIIQPMYLDLYVIWNRDDNRDKNTPQFDVKLNIDNFNINITMLQVSTLVTALSCLQFGLDVHRPELLPLEENADNLINYMLQNIDYDDIMAESMKQSHKYEIKRYMELFAQHYINYETNEYNSQVKAEAEAYSKNKISPKYMFAGDCSCLLENEKDQQEMALLQEVLTAEQINKCRQVVMFYLKGKNLKQLKKNQTYWLTDLKQIEDIKCQLDDYLNRKEQHTQEQLNQQFLSASIKFDALSLNLDQSNVSEVVRETEETVKFKQMKIPALTGIITHPTSMLNLTLSNIGIGFNMKLNNEIGLNLQVDELSAGYAGQATFKKIIQKVPAVRQDIIKSLKNEYVKNDDSKQMNIELKMTADKKLKVNLDIEPISIIVSSTIIDIVQTLLKEIDLYKQYQTQDIADLIQISDDKWDNFKSFGNTAVKQALENHMQMDINLFVSAPKIVIPYQNFNREYQYFMINLGDLIVTTKSNIKDQIKEHQELYDFFNVSMSNMFIINGGTQKQIETDLGLLQERKLTESLLLKPAELAVDLAMCYVVNYFDVDRMLVNVLLSKFQLQINKYQIDNFIILGLYLKELLFPLIDQNISNNDEDTDEEVIKVQLNDFEKHLLKLADEDYTLSSTSMSTSSTLSQFQSTNKSKYEIAKFVLMKCNVSFEGAEIHIGYIHSILNTQLNNIQVYMVQQPYNTNIDVQVGQIQIQDYDNNNILSSPQNAKLVQLSMVQQNTHHPEFQNCKCKIQLQLSQLIFQLHGQSIANSVNQIILLLAETNATIQQTVVESALKYKQYSDKKEQKPKKYEQYPYDKLFTGLKLCLQQRKQAKPVFTVQDLSADVQLDPISLQLFNFEDNIILQLGIGQEIVRFVQAQEGMQVYYQLYDLQLLTYVKKDEYKLLRTVDNSQTMIDVSANINNPKDMAFNGYYIQCDIKNKNQIIVEIDTRELFAILNFVKDFIVVCQSKIDYKKVQDIMQQYQKALTTDGTQQEEKQQKKEQKETRKIIPTLLISLEYRLPIIGVPFGNQIQKQIYLDLGKISVKNQYQNVIDDNINMTALLQYDGLKFSVLDGQMNSIYDGIQNVGLNIQVQLPLQQRKNANKEIKVEIISQQEVQIEISMQLKLLLIEMLQPNSNLGYRIIDEQNFTEEDVNKLRYELKELKQKYLLSDEESSVSRSVVQNTKVEEEEQTITNINAKIKFNGISVKIENPKDKENTYYAKISNLGIDCNVDIGKETKINQCQVELQKLGFQTQKMNIAGIQQIQVEASGSVEQLSAKLGIKSIDANIDMEQFIPLLDYIPQSDPQNQKLYDQRSQKREYKQQCEKLKKQINEYKQGKVDGSSIFEDQLSTVNKGQQISVDLQLQELQCKIPLLQEKDNQINIYFNSEVKAKVELNSQNKQVVSQTHRGIQDYKQSNVIDANVLLNISKVGLRQNNKEQHFLHNCKFGAQVKIDKNQYLIADNQNQAIVNEQQIDVTPFIENMNFKIYDVQIYQLINCVAQILQKYAKNQKINELIQQFKGQEKPQEKQQMKQKDEQEDEDDNIPNVVPESLKKKLQPGCTAQQKIKLNGKKYLQIENKNNIQLMLTNCTAISFALYIRRQPLISFEIQRITTQFNLYSIQQLNQPSMQVNVVLTIALKGYIQPQQIETYIIQPTEIFASIIDTDNDKSKNEGVGQVQIDKGLNIDIALPFIQSAFNMYAQRIYNLLFLLNCLKNKKQEFIIPQLVGYELEENQIDFSKLILQNYTQNKLILSTQTEQIDIGSYQQIQKDDIDYKAITISIYDLQTEELIVSERKDLSTDCMTQIGKNDKQFVIRRYIEDQTVKITISPLIEVINQCLSNVTLFNKQQKLIVQANSQQYIEDCSTIDNLYLLTQDDQKKLEIKQGNNNQQYYITIEKISYITIITIKPSKIFINNLFYPIQIDDCFINQRQVVDSTIIDFQKDHKIIYLVENNQYQAQTNFQKLIKSQQIEFANQLDKYQLKMDITNKQQTIYQLHEQIALVNIFNDQSNEQLQVKGRKVTSLQKKQLYVSIDENQQIIVNNQQLSQLKGNKKQIIESDKYSVCIIPKQQDNQCQLLQLVESSVIQNQSQQDIKIILFNNNQKVKEFNLQENKTNYLIEKFQEIQFINQQNTQSQKLNIQDINGEIQIKVGEQFIKLYISKQNLQQVIQIVSISDKSIYQIINKAEKTIQFQEKNSKQKLIDCPTNMIKQIDMNIQQQSYITIVYQGIKYDINVEKIGRRKPMKGKRGFVFIEVLYNNDATQIIFSTQVPKIFTENDSKVQRNLSIHHINISIFTELTDKTQIIEKFRVEINKIQVNEIENQKLIQLQVSINQLQILDVDNKSNNNYIITQQEQNIKFLNAVIQIDKKQNYLQQIAVFIENPILIGIQQSNLDNILQFVQQASMSPIICVSYQNYKSENINCQSLISTQDIKLQNQSHLIIKNLYISQVQLQFFVKISNVSGISASITYITQAVTWIATLNNVCIYTDAVKVVGYNSADANKLVSQIVSQYVASVGKQAPQILGGLSIIGSVTQSASQFLTGLSDSRNNPKKGLQGIQNSYFSLISNTLSSITQVTTSLTFDEEYIKQRNVAYEQSQMSSKQAAENAVKAVGYGFYEGFTDIVRQPIQLGKQEGAQGVVKGIGKGIASIITKPVSGILDGASHLFIAGQSKIKQQQVEQKVIQLIQ